MHIRPLSLGFRAALLAVLPILATPLRAVEAWVLAGPGIGPLRHPPRQMYGSLEVDLWPLRRNFGAWASVDSSPNGRWVGFGPLVGAGLGRGIHVGLSTGPGWYPDNGRFDLGSHLQFRSTIYLLAPIGRGWEAGLAVSHYSNGGTARHNPGAETMRMVVGIPLGR